MDASVEKPKIVVSACLLGENVRFNGGHSRSRYVTDVLDRYFEWVPVCPEVGMGMSIPREPIRLVGDETAPRLLGTDTGTDYTEDMSRFAEGWLTALPDREVHGFIMMKKSPSCGMARIPVYNEKGGRVAQRDGLFTAAVRAGLPSIPLEEEGRLNDNGLRENFIERVFAYKRWCDLVDSGLSSADLVTFQATHKIQLMSHCPHIAKELGRIVGEAGDHDAATLRARYEPLFMKCLSKLATSKTHANALYHMMGFLKEHLDAADKEEAVRLIEGYRTGQSPLSVPMTLLKHFLRKYPHPWAAAQIYLEPYPEALLLRHHIH